MDESWTDLHRLVYEVFMATTRVGVEVSVRDPCCSCNGKKGRNEVSTPDDSRHCKELSPGRYACGARKAYPRRSYEPRLELLRAITASMVAYYRRA